MMRSIRLYRLSALMFAVAACVFIYMTYVDTAQNWTPVYLPWPGSRLEVREAFDITASGDYRLEAVVPMRAEDRRAVSLRSGPPVRPQLHVTIEGPRNFVLRQTIRQLELGAWSGSTLEHWYGPVIRLPHRGRYTLRVVSDAPEPFGRGAMLVLGRFANTTSAILLGTLIRAIGWTALAIGALCVLLAERATSRPATHPPG